MSRHDIYDFHETIVVSSLADLHVRPPQDAFFIPSLPSLVQAQSVIILTLLPNFDLYFASALLARTTQYDNRLLLSPGQGDV